MRNHNSQQAGSLPVDEFLLKDWLVIFGVILGAFMAVLDIQITNASIQEIAGSLSIPLDQSNNISTAYLVAELIGIPMTAWFVNVLSLRRILIWTTIVFTLSSLACSISWNLSSMVVFRAIQGFAGAPLIPLALTIVMKLLPESKRMVGMALFGATVTLAPSIGPALGGWLTDNFSWQYLFYINVIPSIIVITLLLKNMDYQPFNLEALKQIDIFGVISMAIGLGVLEYVLENGSTYNWFNSPYITTLSSISAVALLLFLVNDFFNEYPLLNIRVLAVKKFGIGCAGYFFLGAVLYGTVFVVPLYLIQVQGYSALDVGKIFIWQGVPQLLVMPLIPQISKHVDKRIMVAVGYLIMAFSCFLNISLSPDYSGPQLAVSMIFRGIGFPFVVVPLSDVIMQDITEKDMAAASSISNVIRNLGGAFGIAFITTLVTSGGQADASKISSLLSSTSVAGWWRLHSTTQIFEEKGADPYTASQQAHLFLQQSLQNNGSIIAFNDVYFIMGISLIGCALSMLFFFEWSPLKRKKNEPPLS